MISIANIFKNAKISILILNFIIWNIYIPISYIAVLAAIISIIVSLLSFEKFLSMYSAISPIIPSIIPDIPMDFPTNISIYIPKISPHIRPAFLPINRPIHRIKITNKFGITPFIVNHVKKLACKKYIIKNVAIINIPVRTFFE